MVSILSTNRSLVTFSRRLCGVKFSRPAVRLKFSNPAKDSCQQWTSMCAGSFQTRPQLASRIPGDRLNQCQMYSLDTNDQDRTTVHILNNEMKNILMINSFSQIGFRLNIGVMVIGSMIIFPESVLAWNVASDEDVNEESLTLFQILEPKLDILVIGYGDRGNKINSSVIRSLARRKIYVESLPTEQACTTYNFLVAESRHVAAAIIPPSTIRTTQDDLIDAQIKQKKLFKVDLLSDSSP